MSNQPIHKLMPLIKSSLERLKEAGLYRTRRVAQSPCSPIVNVNDRSLLAFNSNDYLGLASDPRVVEAFMQGAQLYGVGSGASHLISGHSKAHALLEERLAQFMSAHISNARALYFCTGYMANLAVINALVEVQRDETEVFSEEFNHASIIDAVRLSKAPCTVYPHSDYERLRELLKASKAKNKIVVSDGVFSMDGDIAPLLELQTVCEQANAWLVIDDAHGFGVLGASGRGILEHFNIHDSRIVYMGTLGKAAGVGGAFLCADATLIDWIVQKARSYIYTTAAPPACAHALLTSIDLIGNDVGFSKRAHLTQLINYFKAGVGDHSTQWNLLSSQTPIQPLVIGSNERVMKCSATLEDLGLWVTAIRAPTVPVGTARLRVTFCATHTHDQVDRLMKSLKTMVAEYSSFA